MPDSGDTTKFKPKEASKLRISYLDGLRGLAALTVVFSHAQEFFPGFLNWRGQPKSPYGDALFHLAFFPIQAGTFAVYIFFVLSGIVIARSASEAKTPWPITAVRRYLRLTIPMVTTAIVAWFLLSCFPDASGPAAALANNTWVATIYGAGPVSLLSAIGDAGWRTYWYGASYIDGVLWTMKIELIGSIGIILFYALVPPVARMIALGVMAIVTTRFFGIYLAFVLGTLLYELYRLQWLRPRPLLGAALTTLGLLGGALCQGTLVAPLLDRFFLTGVLYKNPLVFGWTCSATALIGGLILWPKAQCVLSSVIPRFLGRISFFLYLVHFPILFTIAAYAYVSLHIDQMLGHQIIWEAAYVTSTIAIAWAFTVLVDEPTIKSLAGLKRIRLALPGLPGKPARPIL